MIERLLTRFFSPKKQLCCGIELVEQETNVTPGAKEKGSCGFSTSAEQATKRATHIPLAPIAYAANAFLTRRAEMLDSLPGNPYDVHFKDYGLVMGVLVGRAPTPALNRVFGANIEDPALIREFNDWFGRFRAVPAYQVLTPSEQPATAPFELVKLPKWDHVILEKDDLDSAIQDIDITREIRVEQISKQDSETFVRVYAEAFDYPSNIVQPLCRSVEMLIGEPDVLSYVASVSGEPVAVGQLFLSEYGVAYQGSMGTIPKARQIGCQMLLDHRRIDDARKAGYRRLGRTVAINSQSWRNAHKIGFRTVYREDVYAPVAAATKSIAASSAASATRSGCCSAQLVASDH